MLTPLLVEIEEESVEQIEHSVRHIAEIIRVQQGSVKPTLQSSHFYLSGVLQDALIMQRDALNKLGIEVEALFCQDESELFMPRNQMVQVMNNLIKNSYESIIEQMQVDPQLQGSIVLSVEQDHDQTRFSIKDNGVGLAKADQARIFDFGYSSKERGSGFGLHSSIHYIHNVGGSLVFHSQGVGKGAMITLTIPNQLAE